MANQILPSFLKPEYHGLPKLFFVWLGKPNLLGTPAVILLITGFCILIFPLLSIVYCFLDLINNANQGLDLMKGFKLITPSILDFTPFYLI